jgi:transposase
MQTITTIGLDIAKLGCQVHGVDAAGQAVIRRQLKRRSALAFFQKLPSWDRGLRFVSPLVARTASACTICGPNWHLRTASLAVLIG